MGIMRIRFNFRGNGRRLRQCFLRLQRWKKLIIIIVLLIGLYIFYHRKRIFRDIDYLVRPLWGKPARKGPERIIPHFYADKIPPQNRCSFHGWSPRTQEEIPRIFDAFTFSIELDLLEIRMKELWDVVDYFIIVEADRTFTGKVKRLYFQENRERFSWAEEKMRHFVVKSLSPSPQVLFENEAKMRGYISGFIRSLGPQKGDLIVASDLDEIPSRKALELVKSCKGYPRELHLLVQEYLYSFEFQLKTTNWRPHVTIYDPSTFWFHHIILKDTKEMLADAGWHCSFCFRYIADFIFKMTSYSHSDLVIDPNFLDPKEIQRRICEGVDIFELPPEAYSIKDFVSRMGNIPRRQSTLGIPTYVVEEMQKFRFLLPDGCVREDYKNYNSSMHATK